MYVQITIRLNGGIHKSKQECQIEFSNENRQTLKQIKKDACKFFGCKEKARSAIIYNKKGLELFDADIQFIQEDDILYIALDGKSSLAFPLAQLLCSPVILLLSCVCPRRRNL